MRIAIVTGGAQGIGKGVVLHLLGTGWKVAAFDRDEEALAELAAECASQHLLTQAVDVADEDGMAQAFAQVAQWTDHAGLDLLVSNAGIADPVSGPIEELSLQEWRRWQDSHVTGAFLAVRGSVAPLRMRQGSIVLMASTRALQSEPDTEAYAAAKGALCAMTHALAVSLGPEIRVNAILPGWIETADWQKASARSEPEHRPIDHAQHPVGRVGVPADIAGAVAFLASEGAGFITGQQFVIDGGMTRKMIYAD
ncbi:SDR family oxidoreductase [Novosphingobium mangrovi (ex Hu et al. 2023)]|uniref:SDR family oxidoreductase n=1 Tax=Novosphingobium mangrovi (ex Hu et al. 2023) TaxID=2930094 RepID=A0ABT0AAM9_9SPHN|nr:SDR family oxidoreductase [Novosphingobium mangrovi (ex Hu et al. 2023)]MCJ1960237.1 SDR family oxidoreductase [Novosphingobium mangrovi (ex Hu et al. 2023)]